MDSVGRRFIKGDLGTKTYKLSLLILFREYLIKVNISYTIQHVSLEIR